MMLMILDWNGDYTFKFTWLLSAAVIKCKPQLCELTFSSLAVYVLLDQKAHSLRALHVCSVILGETGPSYCVSSPHFNTEPFEKPASAPSSPALNVLREDSAFSCYLPPASCPFSHFLISQIWPGGDLGSLSAFKAEPSLLFLLPVLQMETAREKEK